MTINSELPWFLQNVVTHFKEKLLEMLKIVRKCDDIVSKNRSKFYRSISVKIKVLELESVKLMSVPTFDGHVPQTL